MTKKQMPEIIRTDADGLAENTRPAMLILEVTRREIEERNIASSLERLMVVADSRANALRYREALIIQVTGYNSDRRELSEIPEVRDFFKQLTSHWPHWLWFLNRKIGGIPLLISLLCPVKIHRAPGAFGTEFTDPDEVTHCLQDLFDRGNALFDAFDITQDETEASANSAVAALVGK